MIFSKRWLFSKTALLAKQKKNSLFSQTALLANKPLGAPKKKPCSSQEPWLFSKPLLSRKNRKKTLIFSNLRALLKKRHPLLKPPGFPQNSGSSQQSWLFLKPLLFSKTLASFKIPWFSSKNLALPQNVGSSQKLGSPQKNHDLPKFC